MPENKLPVVKGPLKNAETFEQVAAYMRKEICKDPRLGENLAPEHRERLGLGGELFAVYLQDTNGHRRLVGDCIDLSLEDAQLRMKSILDKHTKPHKVDYDLIGYTRATKEAVLAEKDIAI